MKAIVLSCVVVCLAGCAGNTSALQAKLAESEKREHALVERVETLKEEVADNASARTTCEAVTADLVAAASAFEKRAKVAYATLAPVVSEKVNATYEWAKKELSDRLK